ncbi:MAG: O-antigen ligase family protein [Pirellulales bacterium]
MVELFVFGIFGLLALICFARPHMVLAPALCVYGFEQWCFVHSSYFRVHSTAVNFGFGILCLIAVASLILKGQNPFRGFSTAGLTFFMLYLLVSASTVWSIDPATTFLNWKIAFPYVVAFSLLTPVCIRSEKELHDALIFSLICGTATLLLLYFGTRIHAWGRTIELASAISDRSGTKETRLTPLAPAELAGQVMIITSLMNFTGWLIVWKPARWPVVLMAVLNIVRAGSRGQLLGAFFPVVWFIGASRGYRKQYQLVVGLVTLLVVVVLTVWSFTLTGIGGLAARFDLSKMGEELNDTRVQMCMIVLDYWAKSGPIRWLIGLGSSASLVPQILGVYPHVLVVEVLAELGIIGLILLLAFWAYTAIELRQWWNLVKDDPRRRGLVTASAGLFLYAVILTFKQGTFFTHSYMMLFGVLIGRVVADVRQKAAAEEQYQSRRRLVTGLLKLQLRRSAAAAREAVPSTN